METLALLNDRIDQQRLNEGQDAVTAEEVTADEDVARLLAERVQCVAGVA